SFYHDCQCCTCTERLCMQSLYGADFGDHPAVHSFPTRRSSDLSGEAFLAAQPLEDCSCIILDVRMGDLSGPEVFDRLLAQEVRAPVIFLTGHADVPIAVDALKAGAFDFLEKPFNDNQIVDLALCAIERFNATKAEDAARRDIAARLATLSPREEEVMRLMLTGELNKQMADRLNIAVRTVEVHRGRVLAKMGARNG